MNFLTDFADQAVILPLAIAVALLLAGGGWWRGALAWVVCVGATLAAVGAGKLLLAACGPIQLGDALRSPSGHTASATIVYGGLLALGWRSAWPAARHPPLLLCLAIAAAIAAAIGSTRIALGTHTWAEVIAGAIAGMAGVAVLLRLAGPPPRLRTARLLGVIVLIVGIMHGTHLRAEADIIGLAQRLAAYLPGCAGPAAQARP